ncbi:hypothetical protein JCGZ_16615 [Jatropha curcas]|uniref:beta-galactosidase n=1 Tax=Jatropha curcas TaxID=180498 RepID=A0A067JZ60_JATCU|nr:beta-galactosidase 15 [Jatropha curcas]KDP29226.1 hypothetical protein JCGZ_16615 [Jatropha curcas]
MSSSHSFAIVISSLAIFLSLISHPCDSYVSEDTRSIIIEDDWKLIISGSIHYPRSTPGMWPSLIRNARLGGLNAIETYVFWNAHEPQYRQYDFTGNLDLVRFIKAVHQEGLYVILRIGPYISGEWSFGGLPVWLKNMPGVSFRTNNTIFMDEMKNFTTLIVKTLEDNDLFEDQTGPIIIVQIENDYEIVEDSYGEAGKAYAQWCIDLAKSFNLLIPWIMGQQESYDVIATCNGWYCDQWYPPNHKKDTDPKWWIENWTGSYKKWGGRQAHRTAEDLAFSVARFFLNDGSLVNYYMYHGGTNFGETAGGPYVTTSYDYDAPLDEYGNPNQPKWGHLKNLHEVLFSLGINLIFGDKTEVNLGGSITAKIISYKGQRSCFFSNIYDDDSFITFEGNEFFLPSWSVSISPDCKTEVYNTAKVNAQTSIMMYRPIHPLGNNTPYQLEWESTPEQIININRYGNLDKGDFIASNYLLDQKTVTNGTSDYLWLLTLYTHNSTDPEWVNKDIFLQVHTFGPVIHAFVNTKFFGSQTAEDGNFDFQFETKIHLLEGINRIVLVSVSVGLPYYGASFENLGTGIVGPIKIIARSKTGNDSEVIRDISTNRWVYKTGLHGVDLGYQSPIHCYRANWSSALETNRPFTWYRTNFYYPRGNNPVVVDLSGMGKGVAWVNGINIGRYWTKYLASEEGCDSNCDYKGEYTREKCNTGCGEPAQKYYHIPRGFLKPHRNMFVLFEELGGNPQNVQIHTVTVGKICAFAYEGSTLELACTGGHSIAKISFASFGNPQGKCGEYDMGTCHASDSMEVVQQACLLQKKCSINVDVDHFAQLPQDCKTRFSYNLAVEAVCDYT